MPFNKRNFIIRTSENTFYKFSLHNENLFVEIFYENQNENPKVKQAILDEKILNYSLDIDINDKIHILYITTDGNLNYTIYPSNDGHMNMNIITVKNNFTVDTLDIKVLKLEVHMFYKTKDLNKNIGFIYHSYFHNSNWIDEETLEINCPKYICPYFLDNYKSDLYILYCNNYDNHEYRMKKFNSIDSIWYDFENNIVIKDVHNLNFFITPDNIGIIFYNKSLDRNSQILLTYKDFNHTNSTWSKNITISNNSENSFNPIIFCKEKYTYIMWKQNNCIVYKYSNNLIHWGNKNSLNFKENCIDAYTYISNNFNDNNLKVNSFYMSYMEFQCPLISSTLNLSSEILNPNNMISTNLSNTNKLTKTTILPSLDMNFYLLTQINTLNEELKNYEKTLNKLNATQISIKQNHINNVISYQKQIDILNKKVNQTSKNSNQKIQSLLKIIEEKEVTIQNLYDFFKKQDE